MANQDDRLTMKALLETGLTRQEVRVAMEKMAADRGDVIRLDDKGRAVEDDEDVPTIVDVGGPGQ